MTLLAGRSRAACIAVLCMIPSLFGVGCRFLENRVVDFCEVFEFQVGYGPGVIADLYVTGFLGSAVGGGKQNWYGIGTRIDTLSNRYGFGVGKTTAIGTILYNGVLNNENYGGNLLFPSSTGMLILRLPSYQSNSVLFGDSYEREWNYGDRVGARQLPWRLLDVGMMVQVGLGVRVSVSPLRLFDALCGLFGLDPEKGDESNMADSLPEGSDPKNAPKDD